MAVELVLLDDVRGLGQIGEQVRVADGYARNYLVPKGLAAHMNKTTMRRLDMLKKKRQEQYSENLSIAKSLAEIVAKASVTISVEASEDDKLYGSVTDKMITDALAEHDIKVDRQAIVLNQPIRELGVYNVGVHLHPEVQTEIKVWIVRIK